MCSKINHLIILFNNTLYYASLEEVCWKNFLSDSEVIKVFWMFGITYLLVCCVYCKISALWFKRRILSIYQSDN
jgi:hypothetical protein